MTRFPHPDQLAESDFIPPDDPDAQPIDDARTVPPPPPGTLHHLEVVAQGCEVHVRLNDLPLAHLIARDPEQPEWFAPPVNPYLIGHENMIEVSVMPLGQPADVRAALRGARIDLHVRVYAKGDPVAPGEGEVVASSAVHEELRAHLDELAQDEEVVLPLTFYLPFDNEGPSFADELEEAEPFEDPEGLRDYAIHLRDLAVRGDAAGLVAEMEPKIQAYVRAYDEPREAFYENLLTGFRDQFLPARVRADFERGDVVLAPCGGGRLAELQRPGGAPLLETEPDDEGNTMHLRVLVAPREGHLRIVR